MSELIARIKKQQQALSKRVARWEWFASCDWRPEPFWAERLRRQPPRLLPGNPKRKRGSSQVGYDRDGRLLLFIEQDSNVGDLWFFEPTANGVVDCVRYRYHQFLGAVMRYRHDETGRLISTLALDGDYDDDDWNEDTSLEEYVYRGRELARIVQTIASASSSKPAGKTRRFVCELSYDALGRLEKIVERGREGRGTLYRRPKKGEKLGDLVAAVERRLIEEIPATVKKLAPKERAFCLALLYSHGSTRPLPPCLSVGLESDRATFLERGVEEAIDYMWNPDEWPHVSRKLIEALPKNRELAKACDVVNLKVGSSSSDQLTKPLQRVCKALNELDWSKILDVTDDFFVYPTDYEESELRGHFKAVLAPPRFKVLDRRGWIPE